MVADIYTFVINVFMNTIINNTVHVGVCIMTAVVFLSSIASTPLSTAATFVLVVIMICLPIYWYFQIHRPAVRRLSTGVKCWMRNMHRAFNAVRGLTGVQNHGRVSTAVENCFTDWYHVVHDHEVYAPPASVDAAARLLLASKEHTRRAFNELRGLEGVRNHGPVMTNIDNTLYIGDEIAEDPPTLDSVTRDLDAWRQNTRDAFNHLRGLEGVSNHGRVMTAVANALQLA